MCCFFPSGLYAQAVVMLRMLSNQSTSIVIPRLSLFYFCDIARLSAFSLASQFQIACCNAYPCHLSTYLKGAIYCRFAIHCLLVSEVGNSQHKLTGFLPFLPNSCKRIRLDRMASGLLHRS